MATSKSAFANNIEWQKVTIGNSAGEKMVGVLDDIGSDDLIILCHGFRSSKESATLINLASALLETGISTFRFDFSGNGESEGEFQYGNYWKEADDLRSVVLYWLSQGRRVKALVGHSKGGNAVLLYASKYKDVEVIVNISGRFNLERGMKERLGKNFRQKIEEQGYVDVTDTYGNIEYRVTKESVKERLNTDMKLAVSSIPGDCQVLTVHGSADETVSAGEAKDFDSLISNHTLQILDDADHGYSQHQRALASIVIKFIKDGLGKQPVHSNSVSPLDSRL